jgi:broad specificity phosphatase PhoE
MKLIVVRHGETDLNKNNRLQGSRDPNLPLNAEGRKMVTILRDNITRTPEILYVSPLVRTKETAEILNERFEAPIVMATDILERDFGSLTGKLWSEIDQETILRDLEGHYDYRAFGGECVDDVTARVKNFMAMICAKSERTVMCVTHRGVIRVLYDLYPTHVEPREITPASMHIFDIPTA